VLLFKRFWRKKNKLEAGERANQLMWRLQRYEVEIVSDEVCCAVPVVQFSKWQFCRLDCRTNEFLEITFKQQFSLLLSYEKVTFHIDSSLQCSRVRVKTQILNNDAKV